MIATLPGLHQALIEIIIGYYNEKKSKDLPSAPSIETLLNMEAEDQEALLDTYITNSTNQKNLASSSNRLSLLTYLLDHIKLINQVIAKPDNETIEALEPLATNPDNKNIKVLEHRLPEFFKTIETLRTLDHRETITLSFSSTQEPLTFFGLKRNHEGFLGYYDWARGYSVTSAGELIDRYLSFNEEPIESIIDKMLSPYKIEEATLGTEETTNETVKLPTYARYFCPKGVFSSPQLNTESSSAEDPDSELSSPVSETSSDGKHITSTFVIPTFGKFSRGLVHMGLYALREFKELVLEEDEDDENADSLTDPFSIF